MNNEDLIYEFESGSDVMRERFELAVNRIGVIADEELSDKAFDRYFKTVGRFLLMMKETYEWALGGGCDRDSLLELQERNRRLYEEILPPNYDRSYANPSFAVKELGRDFGRLLSSLYFEMRSMIPNAFELQLEEMVIRLELFLEIYGLFLSSEKNLPGYEDIRKVMYWFYSDYAGQERCLRFGTMVDPKECFARKIITESDLTDLRYLYKFGEYVTDNELDTARHLNTLSESEIEKLAFTFTEGYRVGFAATGKDISIKKTAAIVYQLGFERIIAKAVENLEKIGLKSTIYRAVMSGFFMGGSARRAGYYGAVPNKQFDYDHKDDDALFLDAALIERRLEAVRAAGELYKDKARLFGGPAVMEVFGEKPFSPLPNTDALSFNKKQQKLLSDYKIKASLIQNEYIIGKERSFTIISLPVPEIGEKFPEIFNETVRINTLDNRLYQTIQQRIIDVLDDAAYCEVEGMGDNHTSMKVMLQELTDKSKQTNFENCVADVNIPVGEVFTSPRLKGTEGTLHVTGVYLEGLYFKNLELKFKDGCITDYSCTNFDTEEENKRYIESNILFNHATLPIGEFAIGTNTLAYVVARKYGIEQKLPILIAEKTGPHFAVGDTCYSYEEDNITYNPDGKQIVARENEISSQRRTDPGKAYFSCHTDITIPYDELGAIRAVRPDGTSVAIIENGRFVLPGTEELNRPLEGKEQ